MFCIDNVLLLTTLAVVVVVVVDHLGLLMNPFRPDREEDRPMVGVDGLTSPAEWEILDHGKENRNSCPTHPT